MRRPLLLSILALAAMLAGMPAIAQPLLAGAIRWDNWTPDSPHAKILFDPAARGRLPFFAQGDRLLGGTPQVAEAEAIYARAAGLDYWLFNFYLPTRSFGRDPAEGERLNRALAAHRALADRHGMRFALVVQQSYPSEDLPALADALAPILADRDHLRLDDGSVPLFFMDLAAWQATFGTRDRTAGFFEDLRKRLAARTGRRIALWAMDGHLDPVKQWVGPGRSFAGFTTYADAPPNDGRVLNAAQCSAIGAGVQRAASGLALPYLPNVTLGWDMRPVLRHPDQLYNRSKTPGSCAAGTADWAQRIAAARATAAASPGPFRGLLFYAWNEFAEGGWIAPTRGEGTARIAALAKALGRENRLSANVILTFPAGADWPCPPAMRARDEAADPDAAMRAIHPGGWTRRHCTRVT